MCMLSLYMLSLSFQAVLRATESVLLASNDALRVETANLSERMAQAQGLCSDTNTLLARFSTIDSGIAETLKLARVAEADAQVARDASLHASVSICQ